MMKFSRSFDLAGALSVRFTQQQISNAGNFRKPNGNLVTFTKSVIRIHVESN